MTRQFSLWHNLETLDFFFLRADRAFRSQLSGNAMKLLLVSITSSSERRDDAFIPYT